jgi:hypothetical protein
MYDKPVILFSFLKKRREEDKVREEVAKPISTSFFKA